MKNHQAPWRGPRTGLTRGQLIAAAAGSVGALAFLFLPWELALALLA